MLGNSPVTGLDDKDKWLALRVCKIPRGGAGLWQTLSPRTWLLDLWLLDLPLALRGPQGDIFQQLRAPPSRSQKTFSISRPHSLAHAIPGWTRGGIMVNTVRLALSSWSL